MNILLKLKENSVSVLPVMAIVLLLGLTVVPIEKIFLIRFLISGLFLILGLTVFLLGVDLGIQPMGERTGAELTKKRNITLLLLAAFAIGFIVTSAEPDIQVFSKQVNGIYPFVNKTVFTFTIAAGVGLFIMLGLLRSVLNLSIKWILFISYTIVFVIVMLAPKEFLGVAFDSGGATTGPMTVPFIMALGLGVSSVRSDEDNSFGLTGITSIGPVLAVLLYAIICNQKGMNNQNDVLIVEQAGELAVENSISLTNIFAPFGKSFIVSIKETIISIAPLFGLFIFFDLTLLKMTLVQIVRIVIGFIYSFIGLSIFLTGVNGGFMQAGQSLGIKMGYLAQTQGGWWVVLLIVTGLLFGAIIVCAEPAVWCLSEQVEQVSGGTIKRKLLLIFLSCGTAVAIALAIWRSVSNFDLKYILIPGYVIAMVLMIFCPPLFSGIAFDSGGVASGPLTSTFVLSFTLGAASCNGSNDSFGVIALVAMMPLIAIQIMGIIFKIKTKAVKNAI